MSLLDRVKKLAGFEIREDDPTSADYEETGSFSTPEDGDAQILKQLREMGCDLSKPRHVRHFHFLNDATAARSLVGELQAKEYEAKTYPSAQDETLWVVLSERTGIVDERAVVAERFLMTTLGEKYEAEYDGWEAAAAD